MGELATPDVAAAAPWRRVRATPLLCLLALGVSIGVMSGRSSDALAIDRRAFWGEPWRLVAAPLVHERVWHLLLALALTFLCGRVLERRIGAWRLLLVCVLLALEIGMCEQAFDRGRIGLTAIALGLWAALLAAGWRDRSLRGVVPLGASVLLLLGALACVWIPGLPVSNWGHAAGILGGLLIGLLLDGSGRFQPALLPISLLLLLLLGQGATRWRASWNFGGASVEYRHAGLAALDRGDEPLAEQELRSAVAIDPHDGTAWWNLGTVLARTDRTEEAADACWTAYTVLHVLEPAERSYLEQALRWSLAQRMQQGDGKRAFEHARQLVQLAPNDLDLWMKVSDLAFSLGENEWSERAHRECARLSPVDVDDPPKPK